MKKRGGTWKPPQEEYLDLWIMKAAFNWMLPLDQALSEEERTEWLTFWKQALVWTINILETEEDSEISGTPSEWDRWLFEKIAVQILHMKDNERPDELWKPILDLGATGHYWVDDFQMEWFMKGLGSDTVSDNFIKRWKEMLEYAFESGKWNRNTGRFWYYKNKLWYNMLGMNGIISTLWDEGKISIVKGMKPYYRRWANDFLSDAESAVMFIYFLKRPAAKELLYDALIWLDDASDKLGEEFFTDRHHHVQSPLANLLELSWKRHKDKIKENSATYDPFKSLLRKLVDLQNPQAIEIQQNLLS